MSERKLEPRDIVLPENFQIEVFYEGLTAPINLVIVNRQDMLIADAGVADGNGKVLLLRSGQLHTIADGFRPPLTGITYHQGLIYVAHRGAITVIKPDGNKEDVLSGLPSFGDHHNNRVVFGPDGKMYFGQGTATNSGVVGEDNSWVRQHPFFHDFPGGPIRLNGYNFVTEHFMTLSATDKAVTGAFSPFGVPSAPGESVKGIVCASGSILRANPDGSQLELVAWGLRNPFRMKFDRHNRLFSTNHGMDERGSRPVANSPDEFHLIQPGKWYGWPDYTGGYPLTLPHFQSDSKPKPGLLLAEHPMRPPHPVATFPPHSAIMGFDFNVHPSFGSIGDVFIAEFGSEAPITTGGKPAPLVGHRVSRIDLTTGRVHPFAYNKSLKAASVTDGGGFERPIDVVFSASNEMYIADFGVHDSRSSERFFTQTGVIWRITPR